MPARNLPPLEIGKAYQAADFEKFEYSSAQLTGSKAILRLHLSNGTTIDLPASNDELQRLMAMLCDAFPQHALQLFRDRGWI
jgi:hypothetical protein